MLMISLAFVEDYKPVEAGLGSLQDEKLKMFAIIARRNAPLMVVITNHQGLAGDGPGASRSSVVCACRPQDARFPCWRTSLSGFGDVIFLNRRSAFALRQRRRHTISEQVGTGAPILAVAECPWRRAPAV